ncbi:MAG: 4Fe-4S dicluster domain-containing protein [Candidatus Dormibacteraeota bacterium]|nr:4Fe-4S dicluster domain-containing protein [Candidatus Dormibacteraeota bacterium]
MAERMGFFTDSSICIGCKACEVACKEWNGLPTEGLEFLGLSYDNTGELGSDSWRHVAFIEQKRNGDVRWLMNSDVCKHCTRASCLDVCPTGALFRTEFETVVVQEDVCNGCGYCIPACPFGVIERRQGDGRAFKCTMCYDRLKGGLQPACATACPTTSIQFGPLEQLRERARDRLQELQGQGNQDARLYLQDPADGVEGGGSIFLLLDEPHVYGLPDEPQAPTHRLGENWRAAAVGAAAVVLGVAAAFIGSRR